MWPIVLLEWDLKVTIKKKCLDPNLQKNWSKIDLSLSLGSNNACITSKLIFFPNIIEN